MISQPRLFLLFLAPALCWGNPLPFPFGPGPGDTFTEPNDDLSSVRFSLLRPMMFLNSSVSTVYQNTNGDVTFEMPFEEYVPEVIPSASVPPLAAVYWTDVDTRNGGAEINQLWARVSASAADLEIATTIINGTGSSFEPDDIFVATWYKVEAFSQRVGPQCTFQLAMAYTEQETWVIFSYEQLEFFSADLNDFTAIGFNDGLGVQGELIGIVDNNETMNNLVFQTNCGIPGTYAYRINQEIEFTTPMPNIAPSSSPSISAIPSSIPTVQPSATPILPPPPCARIGVIMDESFSMGVEQAIFPGIVQQIVSNLQAEDWNVFVCSFGFASFSRDNNPYVKGCSTGYNAADFEYEKTGSVEDGYEAIRFALDHWSSLEDIDGMILDEICLETQTTLILVTDEDRDGKSSVTLQDSLDSLINNDANIHMVLNQKFLSTDAIGATNLSSSENKTVVFPTPSGGVESVETSGQVFGGGFGGTQADYLSLAEATAGSVWDISKVRRGDNATEAFPEAFSATVSSYAQGSSVART